MALSYSYNPTSTVGEIRSMIGDAPSADPTNPLTGTRDTWPCIFADEEIAQALTRANGDLVEAACALLLRAASSAAHIAAALRVGDYSRDPKAIPGELRAQAAALRAEAQQQPAEAVIWEIATDFQAREQLVRDVLDQVEGW